MDARAYDFIDYRLKLVENEVTYLRGLMTQAGAALRPSGADAGQAAAPQAVVTPPTAAPQAGTPAWVTAAFSSPGTPIAPAAASEPGGKPARSGFSLEAFIIGRGLQIAGLIILLLGAALFLSVTLAMIGPGGQVVIGLFAAAALLVGGSQLKTARWRFLGDGVIVLGGGVGFLAIWAAGSLYHMIPGIAALVALAAITAAVAALAYVRKAERLAIAAAIVGYLAPFFFTFGSFDQAEVFGYLFVISGGFLILARVAEYRYLDFVAFVGVLPYSPILAVDAHATGDDLTRSLAYFGALFAEFLTALHLSAYRDRDTNLSGARIAVLAACVGAFVLALEVELDAHRTILGAVLFVLAAALIATVRRPNVPALMRETYAWLGLGSLTLAVPALANADQLSPTWSIEAAIIMTIGARAARARITYAGLALYVVALFDAFTGLFGYGFDVVANPGHVDPGGLLSTQVIALAIAAGAATAAQYAITRSTLTAKPLLETVLRIATHLAALTGLTTEIYNAFAYFHTVPEIGESLFSERAQFSVSLLWTVYGAVLFSTGLRRSIPVFRYFALALFVLTIGKVFSVDLAFVDVWFRFLLSLVLGAVLIGASILYQRAAAREEAK